MAMSIAIKNILQALKNLSSRIDEIPNPYPVGAIYISANSTNPSTFLGGTWEAFAKGRTLVGVDNSEPLLDRPLQEGGSKTHRHNFKIGLGWYYGAPIGENAEDSNAGAYKYSSDTYGKWAKSSGANTTARLNAGIKKSNTTISASVSTSDGDTDTASSMQPYATVYMWRRTE